MIDWLANNWIGILGLLVVFKLFHSLFGSKDQIKLTDEFKDVIVSRWEDADYYYGKQGSEFPYDNSGKSVWSKIAKRDNWTCYRCKEKVYPLNSAKKKILWKTFRVPGRKEINIDHIIQYIYGGQGTMDNGRCACYKCNAKRGARIDRDCLLKVREQGKKIYLGRKVPKFKYERNRK